MQEKLIRKAVIPVAGLGTRFLPITKAIPKEMLPIVDRPAVHLIVEEALDSGIEQIVFVTGRQKNAIEDYFDHNFELNEVLRRRNRSEDLVMLEGIATRGSFSFIRQTEPLGLGHAVLCAEPIIGNEPFALLLGDDLIFSKHDYPPALKQLIDAFTQSHMSQVALVKVPTDELHRYGVAEGQFAQFDDCIFDISGLEEKPAKGSERGNHGIVGRYILTPEIWPILKSMSPEPGGEMQITPALEILRKRAGLQGYRFHGTRIDAGDRLGYLRANLYAALHRADLRDEARSLLKELNETETT
jgi:UTP--glucose-1-phosphate uridylyltransferase